MPVTLRVNKSIQRSIYKPVEDYSDARYIIIPVSMLDELNFEEFLTTSKDTARRSVDGKLAIVSFRIDQSQNERPVKCSADRVYSHQEILKIVAGDNWCAKEEDEWRT